MIDSKLNVMLQLITILGDGQGINSDKQSLISTEISNQQSLVIQKKDDYDKAVADYQSAIDTANYKMREASKSAKGNQAAALGIMIGCMVVVGICVAAAPFTGGASIGGAMIAMSVGLSLYFHFNQKAVDKSRNTQSETNGDVSLVGAQRNYEQGELAKTQQALSTLLKNVLSPLSTENGVLAEQATHFIEIFGETINAGLRG